MTQPTKNIADLISQTVAEKHNSEVDLTECPSELLPGRQALKNSSLQKYEELFGLLRVVIGSHSGGIFVTGPGAVKFAEIAEDEAPALVLDAAELYSGIASVWFPTVRVDKVFAVDCMPAFIMGLNSSLFPLGVRRIHPPDFGQRFGTPVNSFDDAVALTRDILRTSLGDELNGLYLSDKLAKLAVAADWDLKFITVVILNATEAETSGELGRDFLFGRSIVTAPPENTDLNDVVIACKHLRAKVTGKTSPTQTDETSPDDTDKPKRKYTRKTPNSQ